MIRILRSLCQNSSDPDLSANLDVVLASQVEFTQKPQENVFELIKDFSLEHDGDLPSTEWLVERVQRKFQSKSAELREAEALGRLKPHAGPNFEDLVQQKLEDQVLDKLKGSLNKGVLQVESLRGKKKIHEIVSAVTVETTKHLLAAQEQTRVNQTKTEGDLTDPEEARAYIEVVHKESLEPAKVGLLTGYHTIDKCTQGLRKQELVLVAGYTGELKSTICRNMLYNMSVHFGYNVLYLSCEVGFIQTRDLITSIHSCHPKWGRPPLEYKPLKARVFSDDEFDFFKEVVWDLGNGSDSDGKKYGTLEIRQPRDKPYTWSEVVMIMQAVDARLPGGLDAVCLDYYEFVDWDGNRSDDSDQNEMIKASKQVAQGFRGGEGIMFLAPFQINNEGYDYAIKHKGEYLVKHLSTHNQSRRSADVVISTYLGPPDDSVFRQANQVKLCNLKNRDSDPFPPIILQTMLSSGRIYNSTMCVEDDEDISPSEGSDISVLDIGNRALTNSMNQV